MKTLSEVKKGISIDNDSNILFKTGKLVADVYTTDKTDPEKPKLTTTKVDIGKQLSSDLNDMFGVFEFECYYPTPENQIVTEFERNVDTMFNPMNPIFKDNDKLNYDVYKFKRRFFDKEIQSANEQISNEVKQTTEYKELLSAESKSTYKDYNYVTSKFIDMIDRCLKIDYSLFSKYKGNASKFFNLFCKEEFNTYNPTVREIDKKYHLDLSENYSWNSDRTEILRIGKIQDSEKFKFEYIKNDIETKFKGSMFDGDRIEIALEKEDDARLEGSAWNITEDTSLVEKFPANTAVEIVSRRIPFNQLKPAIQFMSSLFEKFDIKTTEKTGLHLNIGFNSAKELDLLKVVVLTADDYELKLFNRANNSYCKSQIEKLVESRRRSYINEKAASTLQAQISRFFVDTQEKYSAINFRKWVTPFPGLKPVLEFRIMGGKDYLKDISTLIHRTNRFFYIVSVAGNPELYKEEYVLRLNRLEKKSQDANYIKYIEDSNKLDLKRAFSDLYSTLKAFNDRKDTLEGYIENNLHNQIMGLIGIPIKKVDFPLFKQSISPVIKEINKNQQLKDFIKQMRKDLKVEGSKEDFQTFSRYFFSVK